MRTICFFVDMMYLCSVADLLQRICSTLTSGKFHVDLFNVIPVMTSWDCGSTFTRDIVSCVSHDVRMTEVAYHDEIIFDQQLSEVSWKDDPVFITVRDIDAVRPCCMCAAVTRRSIGGISPPFAWCVEPVTSLTDVLCITFVAHDDAHPLHVTLHEPALRHRGFLEGSMLTQLPIE